VKLANGFLPDKQTGLFLAMKDGKRRIEIFMSGESKLVKKKTKRLKIVWFDKEAAYIGV
jgi:hypothetical protein